MSASNGKNNGKPENLATAVTEVSERVTLLVKEELELAKAEVMVKVSSLSKGLIAGGIGLVFALLFVPFALLTLAWGLNSALNSIWAGFAIVMGVLLLGTGGAFWFAWRKIKVGAPAPKMAIEEAKKIRETVAMKSNGDAGAVKANGDAAAAKVASDAAAAKAASDAAAATAAGDAAAATAAGDAAAAKAAGETASTKS